MTSMTFVEKFSSTQKWNELQIISRLNVGREEGAPGQSCFGTLVYSERGSEAESSHQMHKKFPNKILIDDTR